MQLLLSRNSLCMASNWQDLPFSASPVLGLKACAVTTSLITFSSKVCYLCCWHNKWVLAWGRTDFSPASEPILCIALPFVLHIYAEWYSRDWWLQNQNISQLWKPLKMPYILQHHSFSRDRIRHRKMVTSISLVHKFAFTFNKWEDYTYAQICFKINFFMIYYQ